MEKFLCSFNVGHQIFGLALGGSTYKLPFGHRGLNHPCGRNSQIEITSQIMVLLLILILSQGNC